MRMADDDDDDENNTPPISGRAGKMGRIWKRKWSVSCEGWKVMKIVDSGSSTEKALSLYPYPYPTLPCPVSSLAPLGTSCGVATA